MAIVASTKAGALVTDLSDWLEFGFSLNPGENSTIVLWGESEDGTHNFNLSPAVVHPCLVVAHGCRKGILLKSNRDKALATKEFWDQVCSESDVVLVACHGAEAAVAHGLDTSVGSVITFSGEDLLFYRLTDHANMRWRELFIRIGELASQKSASNERLEKSELVDVYDKMIQDIEGSFSEEEGDLLIQLLMVDHVQRLRKL